VAWHRPGTIPPERADGIAWQGIDIRDAESVRAAVADVRPAWIYHVAGAPSVDQSWSNVVPHLRTNVLGTHNLLEAVADAGLAARVLVVSSATVYAIGPNLTSESAELRPFSPYGLSKLAQDELSRRTASERHLDVVVARPFNHIGPRQDPSFAVSSFARQIALIEAGRADAVISVGNLDARRDFTDVRDVVAAYDTLMAGGASGRAYNICTGLGTRIGDVLDALLTRSRVPVNVAVDRSLLRPGDMPVFVGDGTRIRDELGWVPRHSLDQTLGDTLDWWREQVKGGG
jgi:GDP-4-dehydro-6-deoxy-D-mannose reductase